MDARRVRNQEARYRREGVAGIGRIEVNEVDEEVEEAKKDGKGFRYTDIRRKARTDNEGCIRGRRIA